ITTTSEVVFSIEMVSLPVGGMITRMACGSTTRRSACGRDMPSALAASVCPCSTELMPPRTISAMYAASFSPNPSRQAVNCTISLLVSKVTNSGPNGMPSPRVGNRLARKFQKTSWVITGVPRKNQMYPPATLVSTGFGDSRMTARISPPIAPIAIASTVSIRVLRSPLSTTSENMYWPTTGQLNRGLVKIAFTNCAASTASTTTDTQRPGWRTGTALIGAAPVGAELAGGIGLGSVSVVTGRSLSGVGVDLCGLDRALGAVPLGHDLAVGAVLDQCLHRALDRLGEVTLALLQRDAVRRGLVLVAQLLELPVGLDHRVVHHRRVGQHGHDPLGGQRQRYVGLGLQRGQRDRRLALGLALLVACGDVLLLHGVLLGADGLAAEVVQVDLVRVALQHRRLGAGVEVADQVDGLLALGVDGERGHAQLVLVRPDAQQDRAERAVLELGGEPELLRDGLAEVDVHPDEGLAVGVVELVGRVRGVAADHQLAVGRHARRYQLGQRVVLGGRRCVRRSRTARGRGAAAARPAGGEHHHRRREAEQGKRAGVGTADHGRLLRFSSGIHRIVPNLPRLT